MFIGEYNHSIDSKGRLAIPAKFRHALSEGAVVTRGVDNCLVLYSKEQWREIAQKLAKLPQSQTKARAYARLQLAGAMDIDFDVQGRVTLPEYLRTFAGLKKQIVVAGLFDRLELWDYDKWNKYKTSTENESTEIAESLGELGI